MFSVIVLRLFGGSFLRLTRDCWENRKTCRVKYRPDTTGVRNVTHVDVMRASLLHGGKCSQTKRKKKIQTHHCRNQYTSFAYTKSKMIYPSKYYDIISTRRACLFVRTYWTHIYVSITRDHSRIINVKPRRATLRPWSHINMMCGGHDEPEGFGEPRATRVLDNRRPADQDGT